MFTEVIFLKPFVFCGTIGGTLYTLEVSFAVNSNLGPIHGFVDDVLAAELLDLGLAETV